MKDHTITSIVEWVREVKGDPTINLTSLKRLSEQDLTTLLEAVWGAARYYNGRLAQKAEAAE